MAEQGVPVLDGDGYDLIELLDGLDADAVAGLVADLPPGVVKALLDATAVTAKTMPASPLAQAQSIDSGYMERPHLSYLSDRLARAVADVERGESRWLAVSMPPRSGKSQLTSVWFPLWLLHKHPDWKVGLISHSPSLAVSWGRTVRGLVEEHASSLGVELAGDSGAASEWQTTARGGVVSRSAPGQSITGLGFKVMLIDDVVKDYAAAHSEVQRQAVWDWWLANSVTRLEPPSLVVVVGTRWHEDDFLGRLLSPRYEGDPEQWEVINLPAIAETHDVLGRSPGAPLLSPLLEESPEEALERWRGVRQTVGTYTWQALYQQDPSPAQGSIFDIGWFRFWTTDPKSVTEDGTVTLVTGSDLAGARWLDSWDMAFKGTDTSDYVVGQRWALSGTRRLLVAQHRERMTFTETLGAVRAWGPSGGTAYADLVHERVVEDKANGTAVLDVLREEIPGLVAVSPTDSKEGRARAITPEVEAGNVLLPYPGDPGNEWVQDLLSELRNFPNGAHDDQVDAFTQALVRLRTSGRASVVSPVGRGRTVQRGYAGGRVGPLAVTGGPAGARIPGRR